MEVAPGGGKLFPYYQPNVGVRGGSSLTLPAGNWEQVVRVGDGKSYGLETSLVYHDEQNLFQAGYTLSWSKQKFDDFYSGWYPSKF